MFLIAAFFMGIANFAMRKAVVESNHPVVEYSRLYFGRYFGRKVSYTMEFGLLVGAMLFGFDGTTWVIAGYAVYTMLNGLSAWMLLSGDF
jgi:hypothetical protein